MVLLLLLLLAKQLLQWQMVRKHGIRGVEWVVVVWIVIVLHR